MNDVTRGRRPCDVLSHAEPIEALDFDVPRNSQTLAETRNGFRQTRVSNETGQTHQWRMKRPHIKAHFSRQEAPDQPEINLCDPNTMYCQYTDSRDSLTMPPLGVVPSGKSMLSSSTASGRGEPEEGNKPRVRVSCRVACQAPILTAGFRRRALFRETFVAN